MTDDPHDATFIPPSKQKCQYCDEEICRCDDAPMMGILIIAVLGAVSLSLGAGLYIAYVN